MATEEYKARGLARLKLWNENNRDRKREAAKSWQKTTEKGRAHRKLKRKLWRERNPDKVKASRKKSKQYALVKKAGRPKPDTCEIPNCDNKGMIVFDHCHSSGRFRGWICHYCNVSLGYARDNPVILRSLADYLEADRHKEENVNETYTETCQASP